MVCIAYIVLMLMYGHVLCCVGKVHAAQMEDKDDFPHCLVFGGAAAGGAVQVGCHVILLWLFYCFTVLPLPAGLNCTQC